MGLRFGSPAGLDMVEFLKKPLSDNRGVTIALMTVMIVGLLGCVAIAVDIGMAFNARAEAQRVADSSALAGASAFIDLQGLVAEPEAITRATDFATLNYVHDAMVDASEVTVDVDVPNERVTVWIQRNDIPVWFARFLGFLDVDVSARAVAEASDGGTALQCVLPFAPPDIWHDVDDDTNGNRLYEIPEEWNYDPGDSYAPWDGNAGPGYNGIGYGSSWRGDDHGLQLVIKGGPPGQSEGGGEGTFGPGNFLQWRMPDPDNNCEPRAGASWVRWNIENCNTCPIGVGGGEYTYDTQPGNDAAVKDELIDLIDEDPGAYWDSGCNCVAGSAFANAYDSPRVRPVAFFDPTIHVQGMTEVYFNNFAWVFIEGGGTEPPDFPVYARFIGAVVGGPGSGTGPLVKYLRLVE